MDPWATPQSKILTIINDDYMKMLRKEEGAQLTAAVKTTDDKNVNGNTLVKKFQNLVRRNGNVFSRVKLKRNNSFGGRKSSHRIINVETQKSSADNVTNVDGIANMSSNNGKQSTDSEIRGKKKGFKDSLKDVQWWNPEEESMPIDFCRDTSLHGLKYIGQQNRHISERIFWMGAFILGLTIATILITDVWNKYNNSPIIVSFEPTQISVDRVPFPAITVCNMNKVLKSKAEEYIARAQNEDSFDAKADVFYLDHVCTATKSFTSQFNFTTGSYGPIVRALIKDVDSLDLTKVNEFLRKASQNCSDMIPLCIWQDQEYKNCSQLFRPIETEFGKCCTFNMMPQSELYKLRNDTRDDETEVKEWMQWNVESGGSAGAEGVLLNNKIGNFPRRQMEAGKSYGLSFLLNPNLEEYFCTTSDSTGFRLQTHWPTDTPHVTDFGISIRTKAEVFVNVKPDITLVDPSVFKFDKSIRQCYKPGEYALQYFNYYTPSNCVDECIANETLKECNCKRYYMPRSDNQSLCGGNRVCAENVKLNMTRFGAKSECNQCLPSCMEIGYESQTTLTPLQDSLWVNEDGTQDSFSINGNVTIVHVFIGQDSTYAKVRKELFGTTDLLSNTGGLMGLCLGFSGLSLMEVIYFFTLRAWWASKRKDEIRRKVTKKIKSAWAKVKTLQLFRNGQSVLDKQAEHEVQELEKAVGSSPCKLHVSPVYQNDTFSVEMRNETNQQNDIGLGQRNRFANSAKSAERHNRENVNSAKNEVKIRPDVGMNYKSILGEI